MLRLGCTAAQFGVKVVKTKFKTLAGVLSCVGIISAGAFLPSCSDSTFKSTPGAPQRPADGNGQKSPPENGNNNTPGFLKPGKSLDLYVVMDKSGSLYVDPVSQKMNTGSDVGCKRFEALLALSDSLRSKLKADDEVRLTVVTFSKNANQLGTMDKLLSQTRQQISAQFRAGVCDNPDYETTNYERGIQFILDSRSKNTADKKLDLENVVFFSDGAAKDKDTRLLEESIRNLNSTFPSRIYGVLLGKTRDNCVLKDTSGRFLQTSECMLKVVGNEPVKLLSVDDASGLEAAWAGLVDK